MTTPTMNKMIKVYIDAAAIERLKCGKPNEATVRNTMKGVKAFIRWLNDRREQLGYERMAFDDGFPLVSIVKPTMIHKYLSDMLRSGVKPISAMSYVYQLRQLFAKWVLPYYQDNGWKIPPFPPFGMRPRAPQYNRPDRQMLRAVKAWYEHLDIDDAVKFQARRRLIPSSQLWYVATMMIEFAMRNSDILRLQRSNFVEWEGNIYLNYTPHKTANSSGRNVKWPVHPDIWARIQLIAGEGMPVLDEEVFDALNRQMRTLGFTGTKGAYELRKICIDHIYQRYGAEMAVSISGDDIRTIMHYYADPAQPNIGAVRIIDLL